MKKASEYDKTNLLLEFARGSTDAFKIIYDMFYTSVFYYVKRKVSDSDRTNDITAECFIRFWKSGKRDFDSLEGVKAYLLRSAANACINENRDLKTDLNRQKDIQSHLQESAQPEIYEEDEYKAALIRRVVDEIEKLPKKCKLIFTMAYFDEMKNEEIAKQLNLSSTTVRNQKNRALNILRLALLNKKMMLYILLFCISNLSYRTSISSEQKDFLKKVVQNPTYCVLYYVATVFFYFLN